MKKRKSTVPWRERIYFALKSLGTPDMFRPGTYLSRLLSDSGKWVVCACGEQDAAIPRVKRDGEALAGAPIDKRLRELGVDFHRFVSNGSYFARPGDDYAHDPVRAADSFTSALEVLGEIQARAVEILKKKGTKTRRKA